MFAGKSGLVQEGYFPATKRGVQVQNLQRALAAIETGHGYLAGLPARLVDELADGHREATLDFLWNLLLHFQVRWILCAMPPYFAHDHKTALCPRRCPCLKAHGLSGLLCYGAPVCQFFQDVGADLVGEISRRACEERTRAL